MEKTPYKTIVLVLLTSFLLLATIAQKTYAQEKASASSATLGDIVKKTREEDNRTKILKNFLLSYNSPLSASSRTFVQMADKYQLDWKLVAAISGVESGFAQKLPYNSNNAWGWGIYGNNMIRFNSYDEGISVISQALREKYINKWKVGNIYEIGRFYASDPKWAYKVVFFMNKIDEYALKNPTLTLSISI